jgi:hypothetical protein
MSDFSLMGFVVDRFPEACKILRSAGFQVTEQGGGADIEIDGSVQLPEIQSIFSSSDIGCEFSDIADTIYQA